MLERARIVISIDPSTDAAVLSVEGPLPEQAAGTLRQALRSAAAIAGPSATGARSPRTDESDVGGHHPAGRRVVVDLHACTLLHPVVAECLVDEHERLRARGGAVVCEGTARPATTPEAVPDPAMTPAGTPVADTAHALGVVDVVDGTGPVPVAVVASTTPSVDESPRAGLVRLAELDEAVLVERIRQATRRRTVAVDEPERSASGRSLMALLTEHARRVAAAPPGRPGRAVTGRPSSR